MSVLLFLVGLLEKEGNQQNLGNFGGPTPWRRDPHAAT